MAVTVNRHYLSRQTSLKYLVESHKLTRFLYKLVGSRRGARRTFDLRITLSALNCGQRIPQFCANEISGQAFVPASRSVARRLLFAATSSVSRGGDERR